MIERMDCCGIASSGEEGASTGENCGVCLRVCRCICVRLLTWSICIWMGVAAECGE